MHDCVARQVELDRQEANAKARSASMVPSVVFPLEDARLPLDRGFTHNVGKTAINHSQKHDHFDRWYKLTIPRKSWVIYDIVWPAGDWIHVLRSSGDGKDQDRLGRAHHLFGPSWHSWRYRELLNDLGIEGPALRHSTCVFYIRRTSRANEDIFWTFSLSCRGCLLFFFMVWKLHQFHHPTIWIRLVKWGAFHSFADLIYIVFPRDTLGQLRRVIWVSESEGFGRTWVLSQAWLWVQIDASHS